MTAGECQPGAEEGCTCDGGAPSSRACSNDGNWGDCFCFAPVSFEGGTGNFGDCLPGRYEGEFFGYYYSQYTFGFTAIPVWALSLDGKPGLAFTLNATGDTQLLPGQEFGGELEISDGYVKGTADGLFPFEGKLTGKLDCSTKEFKAVLDGGYSLLAKLPSGLDQINSAKFKGPVEGKYDVATKSFPCQTGAQAFPKCDGAVEVRATAVVADALANSPFPRPNFPSTWSLLEQNPTLPPIASFPYGGDGYWTAQWVGYGSVDPNTGMAKP